MTIPLTLLINYVVYKSPTSRHVMISLVILLLGVAITSGTLDGSPTRC